MLTLVFACILFASCKKDKHEVEVDAYAEVDNVVLVYMAAENNLCSYADDDIYEMCVGARKMSKRDRVIVYVDDIDSPRIYELRDTTQYKYLTPVNTYSTDWMSTSAEALSNVMTFVHSNYKADNYGIVFWSHADGWLPERAAMSKTRSFGIDNGKNEGNNDVSTENSQMSIEKMASVLQSFPKSKFIMFDACLMQCIECDYALRNCADYIIASPGEIPGYGAPYHKIIPLVFSTSFNPVDIAKEYNNYYDYEVEENYRDGVILSVVDCSQLENLASATAVVISQFGKNDISGVADYYNFQSESATNPRFYDFREIIRSWCTDEDIYQQWLSAYNKTVVYTGGTQWFSLYIGYGGDFAYIKDKENCGYVSMYFPKDIHATLNKWYEQNEWYKAAWGGVKWWN